MNTSLDLVEKIKKQDKKQVLIATQMLWQQCQQAWDETKNISLPKDYLNINKIVIAGMGGSHLGGQVIKTVFRQELKFPLEIQNRYEVPGYVDERTLVISTSFSGNTEEVIEFTKKALAKKAKVVCISSNGELEKLATQHRLPSYIFKSTYNPSEIPRYGSGYLFISQLAFIFKVGGINLPSTSIEEITQTIKNQNQKLSIDVETKNNPAKKLAIKLYDKTPVLVASEHLMGSMHVFKNQLNESAKNFSLMHEIPELNHHLLEGLKFPKLNPKHLSFMFFTSDLYHKQNIKRHALTQEVIKKQQIDVNVFKLSSETKLTQAFEALSFTSYVAFYLSILNKVDPGPNPWVDYLKNNL